MKVNGEFFGVFYKALENNKKGIVLEGGSRSGKSIAIIDFLTVYLSEYNEKSLRVNILGAKYTWLRNTLYKDFETRLKQNGIWNRDNWNEQRHEHKINGHVITFIGLDDPGKIYGLYSDIFWINEAIFTQKEHFNQLEMRTSMFFILDYNPANVESWVYDTVLTRSDIEFFHSTYKINPFLGQAQIKTIESYEPTEYNISQGTADEIKWKIFGLGQRASYEGQIYEWKISDIWPEKEEFLWTVYGQDSGFNDPYTLIEVNKHAKGLYVREIVYESGLSHEMILQRLTDNEIKKSIDIISEIDLSLIKHLVDSGYSVRKAKKPKISERVKSLKQIPVFVHKDSKNIQTEVKMYTWKQNESTGKWIDEPIDAYNHALDAIGYAYWYQFLSKAI